MNLTLPIQNLRIPSATVDVAPTGLLRDQNLVDFPDPRERATITEPRFEWAESVANRLNELCALTHGWDGYKGRPTKFDVAKFAYSLLSRICKIKTPPPNLVPLPSGGLQIEWHTVAGDFQFTIYGPYKVEAWAVSNDPDDDGEEISLTNDYAKVLPWIDRLGS